MCVIAAPKAATLAYPSWAPGPSLKLWGGFTCSRRLTVPERVLCVKHNNDGEKAEKKK